ncbi:MAG TPA: hypothetical protein VN902_15970 [Candidatus Acidoferrales bacterium]|nr:hypothetical protein [Candidatus Acidoferrales bacterium]
MKKLIWLVDMSLDGFMSGPDGELDWAGKNGDELWEDLNEPLGTIDAALFGHVTYQNFENYRPAVAHNPAGPKNELDYRASPENRRLPDFEQPCVEKFISAQQQRCRRDRQNIGTTGRESSPVRQLRSGFVLVEVTPDR